MKKSVIRVIEIICFIALFLFGVNRISLVKSSYSFEENPGRSTRLFYELPKNTVDVVFLGDSHSFCGVIPQMIFDNEGISSASLATPTQFIKNSYWMLKDAVKKQNIKVAVIEMHSIEHSIRESVNEFQFTTGLVMMSDFSINKIKGFYDTKSTDFGKCSEIKLDSVYSILQFNSDFGRENSNISKLIDFIIHPGRHYKTFGYYPQTGVIPLSELSVGIENDITISNTFVMEYMEKILELCKENNIELMITRFPYYSEGALKNVCDEIIAWANNNDIKILDYFENYNEIGIDLSTDFRDRTHLNYNGAKKATKYLATYLKTHFNLEDHRGDAKYSIWENNNYSYHEIEKEMKYNIEQSKK